MPDASLTIPQVAARLGVPDWKVRRIVDSLEVEIGRAGLYRLVPPSLLGRISNELQRQGSASTAGVRLVRVVFPEPNFLDCSEVVSIPVPSQTWQSDHC